MTAIIQGVSRNVKSVKLHIRIENGDGSQRWSKGNEHEKIDTETKEESLEEGKEEKES
jgi:hypothetical protein